MNAGPLQTAMPIAARLILEIVRAQRLSAPVTHVKFALDDSNQQKAPRVRLNHAEL
jgi:hypothetical protein